MDFSGSTHSTNHRKTRGRPRKQVDQHDKLYEVHREKNRQSQRLFHARRAAESARNAGRIVHLERTIEKLGNIFIEVADELLGSILPSLDPQLSHRLHRSMQDALTLIKDADKLDQPHQYGLATRSSSTSPPHTPESYKHLNEINSSPTRSNHLVRLQSSCGPRTGANPHNVPSVKINNAGNISSFDTYYGARGLSRGPNLLAANIFGNGWMDQVPAALISQTADGEVHQLEADSLALSIVNSSLYYAYYALWESHDSSNQIFRQAIQLHPREELLFNLRWFLGPGINEMYRLAGVSFNTLLLDWPSNLPSLHPIIDSEVMFDVQGLQPGHPATGSSFINADDVASFLYSKTLRYVDGDVLELTIDDLSNGRLESSPSKPYFERQPTFLNMDVFFPSSAEWTAVDNGTHKATQKQTILVSKSVLFKNLSDISLCLSYGPGFQKQNLEGAVLASAIC